MQNVLLMEYIQCQLYVKDALVQLWFAWACAHALQSNLLCTSNINGWMTLNCEHKLPSQVADVSHLKELKVPGQCELAYFLPLGRIVAIARR